MNPSASTSAPSAFPDGTTEPLRYFQGSPYRPVPQWSAPGMFPASGPRPASAREMVALVLWVVLFDVALWQRPGGYGFAAAFGLAPLLLLLGVHNARFSARPFVLMGLASLTALRCAYAPSPVLVASSFLLLFVSALTLRVRSVDLPMFVRAFLAGFPLFFVRQAAFARALRPRIRRPVLARLAMTAGIPLVLVAVFGGIFALANPVLQAALSRVLALVTVPMPNLLRLFFWCGLVAAGALFLRPPVALPRAEASAHAERSPLTDTIAKNALVALNALFFGYNALDAAYLWAGSPPPGTDTQHYAHAGTFWLTVALLSVTGTLCAFFRRSTRAPSSLLKVLAYVWLGQSLLLAAGTYRRLAIHVAFSGLSDLRIVGILGITLVVSGLGFVAWKVHTNKSAPWLLLRMAEALTLATVSYGWLPTHRIAAEFNAVRVSQGEVRPLLHAFRHAHETESAPVLLRYLDHRDARVRAGVAAMLLDTLDGDTGHEGSWDRDSVAARDTRQALLAARPKLVVALGSTGTCARTHARQAMLDLVDRANAGGDVLDAVDAATGDGRSNAYGGCNDIRTRSDRE
jgi:hypothetical protein